MNVIRGVGYIRVSTAEQATRGLSLDAQEAEIRTYAKAHGIELFNIYVDAGITARKRLDRREAFGQMMKDVDSGLIDEIIVMRLDRWFRNIYDYHKMMNEHLIPHGVNWSAVKEDYDTKTTNGRLMINLRLAIAEQECDTDGDRIRDIHDNQIANGIWIGGCAPPGYRIENKRLSIDPDMQPAVSYFFERLLSCGSVRRSMLDMNERHNLHFEYGQAIRMARSTTYCGVRRENYNIYRRTSMRKSWRLLSITCACAAPITHAFISFPGFLFVHAAAVVWRPIPFAKSPSRGQHTDATALSGIMFVTTAILLTKERSRLGCWIISKTDCPTTSFPQVWPMHSPLWLTIPPRSANGRNV